MLRRRYEWTVYPVQPMHLLAWWHSCGQKALGLVALFELDCSRCGGTAEASVRGQSENHPRHQRVIQSPCTQDMISGRRSLARRVAGTADRQITCLWLTIKICCRNRRFLRNQHAGKRQLPSGPSETGPARTERERFAHRFISGSTPLTTTTLYYYCMYCMQ